MGPQSLSVEAVAVHDVVAFHPHMRRSLEGVAESNHVLELRGAEGAEVGGDEGVACFLWNLF